MSQNESFIARLEYISAFQTLFADLFPLSLPFHTLASRESLQVTPSTSSRPQPRVGNTMPYSAGERMLITFTTENASREDTSVQHLNCDTPDA